MPRRNRRPAPPNWRILIYCILSLLLILALGWFNTHVLGDHAQYPPSAGVSRSAAAGASLLS